MSEGRSWVVYDPWCRSGSYSICGSYDTAELELEDGRRRQNLLEHPNVKGRTLLVLLTLEQNNTGTLRTTIVNVRAGRANVKRVVKSEAATA